MKVDALTGKVTADLIELIEREPEAWTRPWATTPAARNLDGRLYTGWNAVALPMTAAARGYASNRWGTYKAHTAAGHQVRKGERASHVLLWRKVTKRVEAGDDRDDSFLVARTIPVFACEQVDGADDLIADATAWAADTPASLAAADEFFAAVGARVVTGGDSAHYAPSSDTIAIPDRARFRSTADFYATLAHEHAHWTGHSDRLDRDLTGRFGSDAYAAEELVAELTSAMWCAQAGVSSTPRPDHASYLAHWLRVLRSDAKALVTVAAKARAALDHLNNRAGVTETD